MSGIDQNTGATTLSPSYSGVVINQNVIPKDFYPLGSDYVLQEFFLPDGYRRGSEDGEIAFPAISGLQLMVECLGDPHTAEVDWFLEYQQFGAGWTRVGSGTAVGLANQGSRVWFNIFFDNPVEISESNVAERWRFGISSTQLTHWLYSSPNPLALPYNAKAYEDDGITPLQDSGGDLSFCFRVLALSADEGTDFLGNPYRSVARQAAPANISTALGSDPDSYWLSKPNPSKFAVENLYFDVRKNSGLPTYKIANMVRFPSFERGITESFSFSVSSAATANFPSTLTAHQDWSRNGLWAARYLASRNDSAPIIVRTRTGLNAIPVLPNTPYGGRVSVRLRQPIAGASVISCRLYWYDSAGVDITSTSGTTLVATVSGEFDPWVIATSPATAAFVSVAAYFDTDVNDYSVDADVDSYALFRLESGDTEVPPYVDGTFDGYTWSGATHASQTVEVIDSVIDDVSTVIDRVLVDPITPGAYFSVYYTEEGGPGLNDQEWESKLWIRVPHTYRMERRETHVLPEPIKAKYVKIEFCHLQAQHYAPGSFQQAIRYKKHPKWVLDYFLARAQYASNPFLAERVAVVYDALDLAYNYYLDDLGQEPDTTIDVNNTASSTVISFLNDRKDVSDRIDPTTLDKINLVLNQYRQHPALRGTSDGLLAQYARQTVDPTVDYTTEQQFPAPVNSPDVSSLNRDSVVVEQNYPVMFFYLTCRHAYREVEAKLSHDRAYFVGVRELAFLRDNYMAAFDSITYIEPNADTLNVERNEFVS